ncbi:Oligopeptide transport system permease protein OppB [Streptococcus infantarius subsp. infantarius]|nr:Oligopeptide transport system permease protein OppB [Streptococcus infantarius subsp. infantarius]
MKKYVFNRILRSLVSIFLVTTLSYAIVFSLVPRKLIFKQDPNYTKIAVTHDKKVDYENTVYERMGYIDYLNTKELVNGSKKIDKSVTDKGTVADKQLYQNYLDSLSGKWKLEKFDSGKYFATREIPIYERFWKFYSNLIVIDHP